MVRRPRHFGTCVWPTSHEYDVNVGRQAARRPCHPLSAPWTWRRCSSADTQHGQGWTFLRGCNDGRWHLGHHSTEAAPRAPKPPITAMAVVAPTSARNEITPKISIKTIRRPRLGSSGPVEKYAWPVNATDRPCEWRMNSEPRDTVPESDRSGTTGSKYVGPRGGLREVSDSGVQSLRAVILGRVSTRGEVSESTRPGRGRELLISSVRQGCEFPSGQQCDRADDGPGTRRGELHVRP
jgi:hypothetical protein